MLNCFIDVVSKAQHRKYSTRGRLGGCARAIRSKLVDLGLLTGQMIRLQAAERITEQLIHGRDQISAVVTGNLAHDYRRCGGLADVALKKNSLKSRREVIKLIIATNTSFCRTW